MCASCAEVDDTSYPQIQANVVHKWRISQRALRPCCCLVRSRGTACADLRGASGHSHGTATRRHDHDHCLAGCGGST